MVAMLVNYRAALAAPVALFFAALNVGSIQLPIVLKLDSSLAGVLQGTLVLFVLLAQGGARQRFMREGRRRRDERETSSWSAWPGCSRPPRRSSSASSARRSPSARESSTCR